MLTEQVLSLDTETTGLKWHSGDRIVAIIIASQFETYYFNFKDYEDDNPVLSWETFKLNIEPILLDPEKLWYLHNAKFDMQMLALEDLYLGGTIHDTMVVERLLNNNCFDLSLNSVGKVYGVDKSDAVVEWLKEHKHWELIQVPGKQKRVREYDWSKVPYEVLCPYGEQDGRMTFQIGNRQRIRCKQISQAQKDIPNNFKHCYYNELKLVKTVFHMEHYGVSLDVPYCEEARDFYNARLQVLTERFQIETGHPFTDSAEAFGVSIPDLMPDVVNEKSGNLSYKSSVLERLDHPMAAVILDIRSTKKYLDFFNGFLYFKSEQNTLHASLNQAGTKTGRFSCSGPNLQQLTKEELLDQDDEYPVRRAIIPPKGFFFLMIDYDQQEYRMMLDYCGATQLIKKIQQGLDVHTATAELASTPEMPITRKQAKTANFAVLYGSGDANLAANLKVSKDRAKAIREAIFAASPNMKRFMYKVQERARIAGHIKNWLGRIIHFPVPRPGEKEFYYRAPNALIQGGCADVNKVAMNEIDDLLADRETRQVLCIHDELVFEMKYGEEHLIPEIKSIMERVYKHKNLNLTATVEYSEKSLADKKEWVEGSTR